jgi:hypothetical protein
VCAHHQRRPRDLHVLHRNVGRCTRSVFGVGGRKSRPNRRPASAHRRREHEVTRGLRDGACGMSTDQNREGALWGKRRSSISSGCERGASSRPPEVRFEVRYGLMGAAFSLVPFCAVLTQERSLCLSLDQSCLNNPHRQPMACLSVQHHWSSRENSPDSARSHSPRGQYV